MSFKALILSSTFLILVAILSQLKFIPIIILWLDLILSVITFVVYGLDKRAAKNNSRRTSESTLHILSLLGGWPGALYAQQFFRHKSQKTSFRRVFWLTVCFNLGSLIYIWMY